MKIIVQALQSVFKTQRKNLNVFILKEMHRGKQRTEIMSKLDFNLKIYFDTEAYLYHNTLQTMYLSLEHLNCLEKDFQLAVLLRSKSQH